MTVEELIKILQAIEDNSLEVFLERDYMWNEAVKDAVIEHGKVLICLYDRKER